MGESPCPEKILGYAYEFAQPWKNSAGAHDQRPVTSGTVVNLLRPAAIQVLRNIFIQIELYLRGTV